MYHNRTRRANADGFWQLRECFGTGKWWPQSESNVVVRSSNSGESVVDGEIQLRLGMEGVARDTNASDNVSAASVLNLSRG